MPPINRQASVPSYLYYRVNPQVDPPKFCSDSLLKEKIEDNDDVFLATLFKENRVSDEQLQQFGSKMLSLGVVKDNAELTRILIKKGISIFTNLDTEEVLYEKFLFEKLSYHQEHPSFLDLAVLHESCSVIPLLVNEIPSYMWSNSNYSKTTSGKKIINPFLQATIVAIKFNKIEPLKLLVTFFRPENSEHRKSIFAAYCALMCVVPFPLNFDPNDILNIINTYVIDKENIGKDSEFFLSCTSPLARIHFLRVIDNSLFYYPLIAFLLDHGLNPFTSFEYSHFNSDVDESSAINFWFRNLQPSVDRYTQILIVSKLVQLNILHRAISNNESFEIINSLVYGLTFSSLHAINKPNQDGDTALHVAVRNSHLRAVPLLLRASANPFKKNPLSKLSAFEEAILYESDESIKILDSILFFNKGPRKISIILGGLRFAIQNHKNKSFRFLFENPQINAKKCRQLINLALRSDCPEIAAILLHHLSLSTYIRKKGYYSPEVTNRSLQKMCRVEKSMLVNAQKGKLSHFLSSLCYVRNGILYIENLFTAVKNGNLTPLSTYLKSGVDPDVLNKKYWTPLAIAVSTHTFYRLKIIQTLVDFGAQVVGRHNRIAANVNVVYRAILSNNLLALKILHRKDPAIFQREAEGTLIALVIHTERTSNLTLALECEALGFDLNYQDYEGNTFLHHISSSCELPIDTKYLMLKVLLDDMKVDHTILNHNHRYFWQELSQEEELTHCKSEFLKDGLVGFANLLDETRMPTDFLTFVPNEIQMLIFGQLTKKELSMCTGVSKSWKNSGVINEILNKL